ncbi:MAG: 50S ribosomal protein L11 methyltransferase [Cyanobacteriota bacterium]|nr:50S ribosomal protein L11 methyltransferase [Cyanobacteriota bacterium]
MNKKYFELKLKINPELEDLISEIFFENFECDGVILAEESYKNLKMVSTTEGTLRVFLNDDENTAFKDMELKIKNTLTIYRESFFARGLTDTDLGSWNWDLEEKDLQDWSQKWKEKWDVTHVTDNIAVVPDWIEYTPKKDEIIIKMEPGCAFGTGTHQTTQLCMKALEKYLKNGDRVADIGTGSGILAILAIKLGASYAYGCDTDADAIEVAKQNAIKNNVKLYPPLEGGSKSPISEWGLKASHNYEKNNIKLAKVLRNNATQPERILWQYLSKSRLCGVKFRRLQPIGNYIVDFMSPKEKIIIELDGGQHNSQNGLTSDKERDEFLTKSGYTVLRIWNTAVYKNIEGVIDYIRSVITDPTRESKILTLPQGEGSSYTTPCVTFEVNTADKIQDKFDFVCANILHNVLDEIMGDLKSLINESGIISLSGILDEKRQIVLDAINRENLKIIEEITQDQWTSFVVCKDTKILGL